MTHRNTKLKETGILLALAFIIVASLILKLQAQDNERFAQLSFVPYLSTNGLESDEYTNALSFNILGGIAHGLNGFELGGIGNILISDARGIQLAGFGNYSGGELYGAQISGFGNYAGNSVHGSQLSGFGNFNHGELDGAQISGFGNWTSENARGLQLSGALNLARNVQGAQISALSNITYRLEGVQITGLINLAQEVNGCQIGVFNYAHTYQSGTPIGLFSWVDDGFHGFNISYDDIFQVNLRYLSGTNSFYNFLSTSIRMYSGEEGWAFGYGIGTKFRMGEKFYSNLELSAHQFQKVEKWENELNLVGDLNLNVGFQISDGIAIQAGPMVRAYISTLYNAETQEFGNIEIDNPFYTYSDSEISVKAWVGYRIGFQF